MMNLKGLYSQSITKQYKGQKIIDEMKIPKIKVLHDMHNVCARLLYIQSC